MDNTKQVRDLFREMIGIYGVRNVYAMACSMQGTRLWEFLNKAKPQYFVTDAFNWNNTHEGWDFWDKVNTHWQEYLEIMDREYRSS